jgi:uncharacterized protein with HEPN domain
MKRDDHIRLAHMLEAAQQAVSGASEMIRDDLDHDRFFVLGLMKCLEIIGEAASKLSIETRVRYPDIPWPQIIGMRNRLIHAYFDINLDLLWDTLKYDLPNLIQVLERVLEEPEV